MMDPTIAPILAPDDDPDPPVVFPAWLEVVAVVDTGLGVQT